MKRQPQMNGIKSKDATDRGLISKGNQLWILIRRTDAEAEIPTLWPPDGKNWLIGKEPWCWERLRAGGEGDDRGWDGWMASRTRWMWVWVNSRNWWWTGRPGVLRFMGSQRVRHDWATELMSLQSLSWAHIQRKTWPERIHTAQCSLQHCLQ